MGTRLLLTRPAERGNELVLQLRALGHDVSHIPLQTISALAASAPALDPIPSAIIVVSVTAAQFGCGLLPEQWRTRSQLIAVGQATAAALAQCGWPGALTPNIENSEHLLQLSCLQNVVDQRVLLLRGETGRELITDTLQARGARLESLVLYQTGGTLKADAEMIARWAQTAGTIVLSSTQALQQLCAIIPRSTRGTVRLLCLGSRIAAAAQKEFEQVGIISALTVEAINEAL